MATATIPVDLFNPGQVFACLGFLEAAEQLFGDAAAGFDWSDASRSTFHLGVDGDANPVADVLTSLTRSQVFSIAPSDSGLDTSGWDVPTVRLSLDAPFPNPVPPSPATLPCLLTNDRWAVTISHWGDGTRRDNVKFWAGSGGYPGAALARDALDLVREALAERLDAIAADPFAFAAQQSSSFRFDWRRDYIPIDAGFSPNHHASLTMVGYPLVEILAAMGLADSRPQRINKLTYRYGVIGTEGELLVPMFVRAALGGADLPFPVRRFRMFLGWPGQENQARCITNVIEEA